ncbi:tyrosine-protein phosphatase non-receptor type 7-like [Tubulanus polymorphus]|uniref:tyrosine-protein phosphatase non-receptor type 7-like n=1 Tax=Tubulanus polymorphus TaxID=672921 RepID=UPI003DA48CE5
MYIDHHYTNNDKETVDLISAVRRPAAFLRNNEINLETSSQKVEPVHTYRLGFLTPYIPYIIGGIVLLSVIIILAIICCCVKYHKKKKVKEIAPVKQTICLYPVTKPDIYKVTNVQPESDPHFISHSCITNVPAQTPLRIRPKGLLESRRGSSASLTIDLTSMVEPIKNGSPPKESPSREYLLSAGNRMSRKQLRKCLKNVKALCDEFWDIPMNHPDRVEIPGSGMKNRYKTILPNEHSRVKLAEIDSDIMTTYINANFIRGYAGEHKAYIATQGPMSHTVIDFWRLIWQEKVPCIVMITKLQEKNKQKCENYLPEPGEQSKFGDIEVRISSSTQKDGYEIRQLSVKYLNEEHTVMHYWFTSWPDHKTPDTPKQILDMVHDVEIERHSLETRLAKGPVVVHCSAGIGRTGCFIAISIGVKQLKEEQMVDVLGIVCQMRIDRGGMVQNNEQYEFVHRALCTFERELPMISPSTDNWSPF